MSTKPCAVCGVSAHRFGTSDPNPAHEFSYVACVNMLLGEVERLQAALRAAGPTIRAVGDRTVQRLCREAMPEEFPKQPRKRRS